MGAAVQLDLTPIINTGIVGIILILLITGKWITTTNERDSISKGYEKVLAERDARLQSLQDQIKDLRKQLHDRDETIGERDEFIRSQFIVQQSEIVERQLEVIQSRLDQQRQG